MRMARDMREGGTGIQEGSMSGRYGEAVRRKRRCLSQAER